MNSDIKPDFGKLAEAHCNKNHNGDIIEYIIKYNGFVDASNKIWTDHVEPILSTVKRLQEENERLKEAMTGLMNEYKHGADSGDWGSWKAEDQPEYNLCETVLKQLES